MLENFLFCSLCFRGVRSPHSELTSTPPPPPTTQRDEQPSISIVLLDGYGVWRLLRRPWGYDTCMSLPAYRPLWHRKAFTNKRFLRLKEPGKYIFSSGLSTFCKSTNCALNIYTEYIRIYIYISLVFTPKPRYR